MRTIRTRTRCRVSQSDHEIDSKVPLRLRPGWYFLSCREIAGDLNRMLQNRNHQANRYRAPRPAPSNSDTGASGSGTTGESSAASPSASPSSEQLGGVAPQSYELTTSKGDKRRKVEWSDEIVKSRFRKRYNVGPAVSIFADEYQLSYEPCHSGRSTLLLSSDPPDWLVYQWRTPLLDRLSTMGPDSPLVERAPSGTTAHD